jgi:hypothetical protein
MGRSSLGRCGIAIEDIERPHPLVMFGSMLLDGVDGLDEDAFLP